MKHWSLFILFLLPNLAWSADIGTCARTLGGVALSQPLPVIKQDECGGKCGPTSLAIAAAYFGRTFQTNPLDRFETSDRFTSLVLFVANSSNFLPGAPDYMKVNSGEVLAATARTLGLYANAQFATLSQIAQYMLSNEEGDEEAILIHWWMGPDELDYHWSVVQALAPSFISLRDPWPSSPDENNLRVDQFQYRTITGTPGVFPIVRVSSKPLR